MVILARKRRDELNYDENSGKCPENDGTRKKMFGEEVTEKCRKEKKNVGQK